MGADNLQQLFGGVSHSPSVKNVRQKLSPGVEIKDFCVPINMGFPNERFMTDLYFDLQERLRYYPSEPGAIAEKLAAQLGVSSQELIVGNGSTEIFYFILSLNQRRVLTPVPTFGRWTDAPKEGGHFIDVIYRREEDQFQINTSELILQARANRIDTLVISNPNNPTGALTSKKALLSLVEQLGHLDLIIIDESFLDFSPRRDKTSLLLEVSQMENVVVLKSLGKSLGLHGIRLGVMVGNQRLISRFKARVPYWNINGIAEGVIDLLPKYSNEFNQGLTETIKMTSEMIEKMSILKGYEFYPTDANFVYMKAPYHMDAIVMRNKLLADHGLYLRSCGNKIGAKDRFFRIATRPGKDIDELVAAIGYSQLISGHPSP